MPPAKIYLPKQWTDWTTWLLGIWLCLSPWILLFETETPAIRNAVLLGILIIFVEVIELSVFRGWEEWINVALGAWLIASSWVLGIATPAAKIVSKARIRRTPAAYGIKSVALRRAQPAEYARRHIRR